MHYQITSTLKIDAPQMRIDRSTMSGKSIIRFTRSNLVKRSMTMGIKIVSFRFRLLAGPLIIVIMYPAPLLLYNLCTIVEEPRGCSHIT